ncbi:MAG: helix-turn-helix transcriptional regulator, partial [Giesbergeria sp.]
ASLWLEWQSILEKGKWRKVLGRTRHALELRQASPLTPVLPAAVRERILSEVSSLKQGVVLGKALAS